jgi:hypothetical protein
MTWKLTYDKRLEVFKETLISDVCPFDGCGIPNTFSIPVPEMAETGPFAKL